MKKTIIQYRSIYIELEWDNICAVIQNTDMVYIVQQHPKEPLGIALHVKTVLSPQFIMRIESEERDFSRQSVGGSSGTLDGEQRWKERPSISPQNQSFLASSLGIGRSHSPVKTNQSLRLGSEGAES